jgi:internalin A
MAHSFYKPTSNIEQRINELRESGRHHLRLQGLKHIPEGVWTLDKIQALELVGMQDIKIPDAIGLLTGLKLLGLYSNHLEELPAAVGLLTNLKKLGLSSNEFRTFPKEIFKLERLKELRLSANWISEIPAEIGSLRELVDLRLKNNAITSLPAEIGNLRYLERLSLASNGINTLPPEIGNLRHLKILDLRGNPIRELPAELGNCTGLSGLLLTDPGKLSFPPGDVAELGVKAILGYLQAAQQGTESVWESKLLIVGEGAVGKTWLYEALNERKAGGNRAKDGATLGIEIGPLDLVSPDAPEVTMRLNCWDFSGQDTNHATHQFFFSERTLFLLCWNARAGWEAGKLRKWLTNIKDRAPNARVILVATHYDQPHSDYPEKELRGEFGQIVASFKVSNCSGENIEDLKQEIARQAHELPMMGLKWPKTWRTAQQQIKKLGESKVYATLGEVEALLNDAGLSQAEGDVLLRWLHELGETLHYVDIPELSDIVVLDPQWVTKRVGEVLASADVQKAKGVLTKSCIESVWPRMDTFVRGHLLGMMERFDLAYRIPDDEEHRCLVVERLPQNPPDYESRWGAADKHPEVRLSYRMRSMHPGIPTWFIARCHRFTIGLHWLRGVVFGDNRQSPRHLALITANESERQVNFAVRGPQPWTFLPLLTDGFEDTILRRYPGLAFERMVPCPGRKKDKTACDFEFNLKDLEAWRWPTDGVSPEHEIQCTRCRSKHDIDTLLLGLSRAPNGDAGHLNAILNAIQEDGNKTRESISAEKEDMRRYLQLEFIREWNSQQTIEEQSCPTVFAFYPVSGATLTSQQKFRLQLYCANPNCWHSIGDDGMVEFQPSREGLIKASRWLRTCVKWLRPAAVLLPSGSQLAGEYSGELLAFSENASNELKFTAEIFKEMKDVPSLDEDMTGALDVDIRPFNQLDRMDLYELKTFLGKLDFPIQPFGGLRRVRTPEGHILWLCAQHAADFNQRV